jgi:hypothetical protein
MHSNYERFKIPCENGFNRLIRAPVVQIVAAYTIGFTIHGINRYTIINLICSKKTYSIYMILEVNTIKFQLRQ